jgi:hypothetical protein
MLGRIELSVRDSDKLFLPIPETNFSRPNQANPLGQWQIRRSSQPTKVGFSLKVGLGNTRVTVAWRALTWQTGESHPVVEDFDNVRATGTGWLRQRTSDELCTLTQSSCLFDSNTHPVG